MFNLDNFKPNPNYGNGVFRRHIRLTREGSAITGKVYAELEDCNHGFQCTVDYRDGKITAITPEFKRIPFTTCDGAWRPLEELINAPVNSGVTELLSIAPALVNCTHLHDLTLLAIAHTQRTATTAQYEVEVSDAKEGTSQLHIFYSENDGDKKQIHHWEICKGKIISPEPLKDKPLFKGFSLWANACYSGLENEAAFVLQKGNLVSIGRSLDVEGMAGNRAIDENPSPTCFTYSPEHAEQAIRLAGTTRDFTDTSEQLLKFI